MEGAAGSGLVVTMDDAAGGKGRVEGSHSPQACGLAVFGEADRSAALRLVLHAPAPPRSAHAETRMNF